MSRAPGRLNRLASLLLGGLMVTALAASVTPGSRLPAQTRAQDEEGTWPETLQVYPAYPGDPVKLVRIVKAGKELVPGAYAMPQIAGDGFQNADAVKEWLTDVSFVLKSETSKNIVSVGIAIVFPVRATDEECFSITGSKSPGEPWCDAHPHWCDGGCPGLIDQTLHWGLIPALTASGLEARYRAEAKGRYGDRVPLQGRDPLRLAPGEEVAFSLAGRAEGIFSTTDPRHGVSDTMNGIVYREGLEEARDAPPCAERAHSKTGCAFVEAPKFNIGLDIVYFEDGTIWGNYGYGFALPNPDGIFTRVDASHSSGIGLPASPPN